MLQNITLSAEKEAIEAARAFAKQRETTLNALFRRWLERYTAQGKKGEERVRAFRKLIKQLDYVEPGRKFSRDEMNAR